MEGIIFSPPELETYDRLKAELVCRLSNSHERRVRQLLSHEEMGDRNPSQFRLHLKSLDPDVHDDFLRNVWASRLPTHFQASLAGQIEGGLVSTSRLADRLCYVTRLSTKASISQSTPDHPYGLVEPIGELSRQVASLQALQTNRRSQSRDHHHPHTRDRFRSTIDNTVQPRDISW